MIPNQTQGIGHQKCPTHMHRSTPSPKFSSVLLYDQPFSRYCTYQDFPTDSYVKLSKCCHKIFKFWQISSIYHNFLYPHENLIYDKVQHRSDENWRRSSVLKFLLPQGPMLTKMKKNRKNLKIESFEKRKKLSGDMVERELPTKFGLDLSSGFRET